MALVSSPCGKWATMNRGDGSSYFVRKTDGGGQLLPDWKRDLDRGESWACVSPDDKLVATSRDGGLLIIFSTDSGRVVSAASRKSKKKLTVRERMNQEISCGCFSPNSSWIATGSNIGNILKWDAECIKSPLSFPKQDTRVKQIRVSADEKRIISRYQDMSLRVWNAATAELVWECKKDATTGLDFAISKDGAAFATSTTLSTLRVWHWDAEENKYVPLEEFPGLHEECWGLRFLDGKEGNRMLAAGGTSE